MSNIQLANSRVSLIEAARLVGMDLYEYSGKQYCPFGHLFHADGGTAKAFRVYPETNSAFCFAGCGSFRPVSLVAMSRGITQEEAAEYLLDLTGYVPPDIDSRWAAATATQETVDLDLLAEALKVACEGLDPLWEVHQFEEGVASKFRQCLELLPQVTTRADAARWLSGTKRIMEAQLGASTS